MAISHLCFNTRQQQLESGDAEFLESTPAADKSGIEIRLLPAMEIPLLLHTHTWPQSWGQELLPVHSTICVTTALRDLPEWSEVWGLTQTASVFSERETFTYCQIGNQ